MALVVHWLQDDVRLLQYFSAKTMDYVYHWHHRRFKVPQL